jgi:cytidine deaminase
MKNQDKLIREAILAKINSYSPYSRFRVGAAVLLKDGTIVKGSNIENASYGLSICAERACLFNMYSLGYHKKDVAGFAVSADTVDFISPCGACRQVMAELLDENCSVFLINKKEEFKEIKVKKLLPFAFKGDDING